MSDRLKHTPEGYLRAMQMTTVQLIAFVEGEDYDEYFYSKICQTTDVKYQVRRAREIPLNSAGGKRSLILWFKYLEEHLALFINSSEQKQVSVFFLDKDVDDILGKMIESQHIVYTEYYCIENYIFVEGDLNKVAAIIASRDPQKPIIGDCAKWRQEVAKQWKTWVKLCLFSRMNGKCECNYGSLPEKNKPLYEMLKDDIYSQYKEIVKVSSKLTENKFNKSFSDICKKVDELYAIGKHDSVFKGKWYAGFFEVTIEQKVGKLGNKTVHKSYSQTIISTLDFSAKWTKHFKKPLKSLIGKYL